MLRLPDLLGSNDGSVDGYLPESRPSLIMLAVNGNKLEMETPSIFHRISLQSSKEKL